MLLSTVALFTTALYDIPNFVTRQVSETYTTVDGYKLLQVGARRVCL
jgi:hypothetical protein